MQLPELTEVSVDVLVAYHALGWRADDMNNLGQQATTAPPHGPDLATLAFEDVLVAYLIDLANVNRQSLPGLDLKSSARRRLARRLVIGDLAARTEHRQCLLTVVELVERYPLEALAIADVVSGSPALTAPGTVNSPELGRLDKGTFRAIYNSPHDRTRAQYLTNQVRAAAIPEEQRALALALTAEWAGTLADLLETSANLTNRLVHLG